MDPTSELTPRECWTLLESADLGRLAICYDGVPEVFPVNYAVAHGTLVYRTAPGLKHVSARLEQVVAFEVDDVDRAAGVAWSVVVKGHARDVTSDTELALVESLPLHPLHPGDKAYYVRIEPDQVTGRRITTS